MGGSDAASGEVARVPSLRGPRDARLYLEREQGEIELFGLAGGVAAVYSARSPDRNSVNEDAAALIPFDARSAVLVVADGVGGAKGGAQAASLAVRSLETALVRAAADGGELRTAILDAVERAQRAVAALGGGAATTLAVVEIRAGRVRPYHVGDSAILVVGQRGRLKLQTIAHSPVGFAVEAGLLDEREALHHEERHVVSNVLGAPDMRVEIGAMRGLAARDTLLLASDGLFDNLHLDEVVERVRRGPLEAAARRLAEDCRRRMVEPRAQEPSKPDDLTLIAFRRT
jgi:serine/threonine protein phosphatase PrpC